MKLFQFQCCFKLCWLILFLQISNLKMLLGEEINGTTQGSVSAVVDESDSSPTTLILSSKNTTTNHITDSKSNDSDEDKPKIGIAPDTDSDPSDIYEETTGKTRLELIESGEYWDKTWFGPGTDSIILGERTLDFYIPRIRRREEIEHGHIARFYFSTSDIYKWPDTFEKNLKALRRVMPHDAIKFILFTQKSPPGGELIDYFHVSSIRKSTFDPDEHIKILIHGYMEFDLNTNSAYRLKNAYLAGNYTENLIVIDWTKLSNKPSYYDAAMHTQIVADEVGNFITILLNRYLIKSLDYVHIIGHCLGAHVAGIVGHHVKEFAPGEATLFRITGLDPTNVGFVYIREELCLDKNDAYFVDIIHTNMGRDFGLGTLGIIPYHEGDIDFFPNSGVTQPQCTTPEILGDLISTCSHKKSVDYYIRSIKGELFKSCACSGWAAYLKEDCDCLSAAYMGEQVRTLFNGPYYLDVYEKSIADILGFEL